MNKIKRLVVAFSAAFLVLIGIGGTAYAARTDMLDLSDYNNNGHALTTQQFVNLRNNYGIKAVTVKISEGQTWNASTARANISDASQAGLYTNGYHFSRYNSVATAQAEARHTVQQAQVDGLGIGSVIVTDAESSAQSGVSKATNGAPSSYANNTITPEVKTLSSLGITTAILPTSSGGTTGMCTTYKGDTGNGYQDVRVLDSMFPVFLTRQGTSASAWSKWHLVTVISRG